MDWTQQISPQVSGSSSDQQPSLDISPIIKEEVDNLYLHLWMYDFAKGTG
jgi:hypothetical protein